MKNKIYNTLSGIISKEAFKALPSYWKQPCEASFDFLANNYPIDLAILIKSNKLDPSFITFAAESLGQCNDSNLVINTLIPLLKHPSDIVREGAIYGLSKHNNYKLCEIFKNIYHTDNSQVIREVALGAYFDCIENLSKY